MQACLLGQSSLTNLPDLTSRAFFLVLWAPRNGFLFCRPDTDHNEQHDRDGARSQKAGTTLMIRSLFDPTWWQIILCLAVPINYLFWWLVSLPKSKR